MKRTGIKRKTPLNRGSYLPRRRRRPRMVWDDGEKVRKRERDFGVQASVCRLLPCCVCEPLRNSYGDVEDIGVLIAGIRWGLAYRSDPHHEPPRSCGGTDKDCVPLCRDHHDERHRLGLNAFEIVHRVGLKAVASRIHEEVQRAKGAGPNTQGGTSE